MLEPLGFGRLQGDRRGTWQDIAKTWDVRASFFRARFGAWLVGAWSGPHQNPDTTQKTWLDSGRNRLEPCWNPVTRSQPDWKLLGRPVGTLSDQSRNMAGNLLNPLETRSKPFFPRRTSEPSWNRCRTGRETRQRPTYPFSHDSMECSAVFPGAISITLGSDPLLTEFQPIPFYENLKPRDRFSRSEPGPWLF